MMCSFECTATELQRREIKASLELQEMLDRFYIEPILDSILQLAKEYEKQTSQ